VFERWCRKNYLKIARISCVLLFFHTNNNSDGGINHRANSRWI